ncbi:hypothetical protein GCM10023115_10040 [Pontixanthobacter gangjinensis]
MAAERREAGYDMIARLYRTHFAAHCPYYARRFMPGDTRQCVRISAVNEVQVGMAQAASFGVDQNLVRGWISQFDLANDEAISRLF